MPKTIKDGETTTQDAAEALVYEFDYDTLDNLAVGVQLASVGTVTVTPSGGLTTDNLTIGADGRSVSVRVAGGRKGAIYEVRHTVATSESVPQTKSKWFKLRIT